MVKTRPKNALEKIPDRTKIDLIDSPPQPKKKLSKTKKKLSMETPAETTPTSNVPKSPELPGSAEIADVFKELAPTPRKNYKKKLAKKDKATPSAGAEEGNTEDDVISESKSFSKKEEEAKEEQVKEGGEDEQEVAEETEDEDQAEDEKQEDEKQEEEEEGKGSAATINEKKTSSSTLPPLRKRTRAETKLPTPPPERRGTVSSGIPPKSSFTGPPTRQIVRVKVFDTNLLKTLGVYEGVKSYFAAIGWGAFLDRSGTVYPLLAREFVQSLKAKPSVQPKLYL